MDNVESIGRVELNFKVKKNSYNNKLEQLKIELGHFIKLAEQASKSNTGRVALKARKKSMYLRDILKEFREWSLENEKQLKESNKNTIKNVD